MQTIPALTQQTRSQAREFAAPQESSCRAPYDGGP